jgi:hypothetical protein
MWKQQLKTACNWADRANDLDSLDPNNYRASYSALLKLFTDFVTPSNYETVLSGALAVYGWMPTILKNPPSEDQWCNHRATLQKLRDANDWEGAACVLDEDAKVLKLINNSVVGTSKFLHFLNPGIFPIWDSRIARCIGLRHKYELENTNNYRSYAQSISDAIEEGFEVPKPFLGFIGKVSPVRRLEMLLFLYGKTLGRNRRSI